MPPRRSVGGARRRRRATAVVAALFALLLTTMVVARPAAAAVLGRVPWAVVMCKVSDNPAEPMSPSYVNDLFTMTGTGLMYEFWLQQSYGQHTIEGTVVTGWYTLPTPRRRRGPNHAWNDGPTAPAWRRATFTSPTTTASSSCTTWRWTCTAGSAPH